MSDYAQLTSFTPKDSLISGNPLKLVRGSEIDAEFSAISVAIATKLDSGDAANPTGTVGLAAVNGSASTYMRSDAAPALSQSIAPTWTAAHTWSVVGGQDAVFNSTSGSGAYVTFQRSGTALADIGNAAQVFSGGTLDNFAISTRSTQGLQFGTNGAPRLTIASNGDQTSTGAHLGPSGSASAVSYGFSATNGGRNGLYYIGTDNWGLSGGGSLALELDGGSSLGLHSRTLHAFQDGSAAVPGITFNGDIDTGIYRAGSNLVRISCGNLDIIGFANATGTAVVQPYGLIQAVFDGTLGAPFYSWNSDTDTGMYRAAANDVRIAAGATDGLIVQSAAMFSQLPHNFVNGSVGDLSLRFGNDTDTGFYRIGANQLGFAEGGTGFRIGFRSVPVSSTTTTLVAEDNGKCVSITAAINIPASVFAAGDCVSIYNNSAGALNITISAGTLRLAGTTTTGTRSLAARGVATLWVLTGGATPEVICSGNVT